MQLKQYVARWVRWLFLDPSHFWIGAAPVLLGVLFVWAGIGPIEKHIRWLGLVLQILGLCTVVAGFVQTRKHFGHVPLRVLVLGWARRIPLRKREPVVFETDMISVGASLTGGFVTEHMPPLPPDADTEFRIARLETALTKTMQNFGDVQQSIESVRSANSAAIASEQRARESGDRSALERLETSSTGGIRLSAIGTAWLFVGVVLGTASPEVALWFGVVGPPAP